MSERVGYRSGVAVVFLLLALPVSHASAARKPTPVEAGAIRFALAHDLTTCCIRPRSRVARIVVSTADPHFATVLVERLDKSGRLEDEADVLLWHGTKRWAVIETGSDFVGCDFVSAKVRRDLFGTALCP